jgi:tRNA pseudouridine13 synthase
LICTPKDVTFAVKVYHDPLQPLLNTDLMELSGSKVGETKTEDEPATLFGMVIGFTLPPSSYATIALRELTKRPTSSEYQSKLELDGKCERNLS